MEENVYKAPDSDLGVVAAVEVPEEILKKIKGGWIAAIISGVITLIFTVVAISNGGAFNLYNIWSFTDVVLIFALAFGIYMKSRIAATSMFGYFLLSKIIVMVETGQPSGIILSLVFLFYYFRAMVGTFQYHNYLKAN